MIPREILKKIRQIELRTNRLVQSSSPVFQLFRFAAGVEHGQNHDAFGFNQKMDHKRKATDNGSANFASDFRKPFGIIGDALKVLLDGGAKFLTQAFTLVFVIGNGIVKLLFATRRRTKPRFICDTSRRASL